MAEKKFEIVCYAELTKTLSTPILLQIDNEKIIISARAEGNGQPSQSSLGVIKAIDEFLHKTGLHEPTEQCEQPEKITFFIRWT